MSIDRRVLPVFGLASIVSCANEPQSPLPARPPNATFASAGADAQTIAASHANADQEQPTRVDADAPVRRTSIVVRQPPVPAGWVSVVPFAASAFSKATVFFRHGYSEPRACVAWRYAGHLITVVENASSAFGASGLNLAGVGVGPDLGPLRRRTRYKMVLESGTLARGPYRFHIEEVESAFINAKGREVHPPGYGEGWGGGSEPTFTVVAEEAAALVVIDDESEPFIAFDPQRVERWFTDEAACKADAAPAAPTGSDH